MRIIKYMLSILVLAVSVHTVSAEATFPYGEQVDSQYYSEESTNTNALLKQHTTTDKDSLLNKLLAMYGLDDYNGEDKAIHFVKGIINLLLSLASFVVFVWLIYGFYMMFFSEHEEGMDRARKIIKMTFIALLLIGVSRLLVNFFFYLFEQFTSPPAS